MYKQKNYLERLITSLSKEEKRHYTLLSLHQESESKKPHHFLLYQYYDNGKSGISKPTIFEEPGQFYDAKRQLYRILLRRIRDLNEDSSPDISIQNKLNNVVLLYQRSLPEQGMLELKKAYQEASKFEKFGLMLQLLDWEKKLNSVMAVPSRKLEVIQQEGRDILRKFTQQMDLEGIYNQILKLKKELGYAKGKDKFFLTKATIKSSLIPTERECLSNSVRFYRHYIYAIYYWMVYNHKEAFVHSKKMLAFDLNNIQSTDYVNGIFQHITSCVCMLEFDEALRGISLAETYSKSVGLNQSVQFAGNMFAYKATYKMVVLNYIGDFKLLKSFVKEVELNLQEKEKTISVDALQIIMANLLVSYVGLHQLDQAADIRQQLIEMKKKFRLRQDVDTELYFFQLFYLIQTGVYELVVPAAQSALRYFRKHEDAQRVFEVEMPIALLLSKSYNFEDKKVLPLLLAKCRQIVNDYILKLKGTIQFQEHYTRYLIWFDAIEKNKPFHEAAKEWYSKFLKS